MYEISRELSRKYKIFFKIQRCEDESFGKRFRQIIFFNLILSKISIQMAIIQYFILISFGFEKKKNLMLILLNRFFSSKV